MTVICSHRAFLTPVPDPGRYKKRLFRIAVGDTFDPADLARRLQSFGYSRVPRVTVRGEYALRGEVVDLFQPGDELALRIVFDFDEIEQIKGLSGIQRVAEFLIEQCPVTSGACTVRLPYEKTLITAKLGMKAESLSRVFQRLRRFRVSIKGDMAVIDDVETLRDAVDQDRPSALSR